MSKGTPQEEKKPGVPIYIVTFSDMVTLLLTFFVMLLSMATDQSNDLFQVGQISFKRALADFGFSGFLVSKKSGPNFDYPKPKYKTETGNDNKEDRSIDAETEMVRRILLDLEKSMEIIPSQITGKKKNFTFTDIYFHRDSWTLNEEAKEFLKSHVQGLQEIYGNESIILYTVGLGASERTDKLQWVVSARRAQAVSDYIKSLLPVNSNWFVCSWGAGDGGDWVSGSSAVISKDTEIMLVTLTGQ